jgi:hypothetical protein
MKRMAIAVVTLAVGAAGCGSKSSTTGPSNQPVIFTANLAASNEVPPVTNGDSNAKGTAVITFHPTRDSAGNVTGGTIDFNISVSGFPNGTTIILSHIHGPNAPAGVPAGVFIDTGLTAGTAIQLPNGTGTYSFTGVNPPQQDRVAQVLANPSQFYFNAHTPANPGGAIRGQLL